MSATIEAITQAWRLAGVETRELVSRLLLAAHRINRALAVPAQEIGYGDPGAPNLNAESSAELVRAELERYESLAARYQGLPLELLFAIRASAGVIPGWSAVERKARDRGGPGIAGPVVGLQEAYADVMRERFSLGSALDDSPARVWLYSRLDLVQRQPEQSSGAGKWILGALALWLVFRGGDK